MAAICFAGQSRVRADDICVNTLTGIGVPGLSGLPIWPTNANPSTVPTTRDAVSDPRWGDGPMVPFYVGDPSNAVQEAGFRMVMSADRTQLAVSMQMAHGPSAPTGSDFAYFGLAQDNGAAWGVRIPLNATGRHVPVTATFGYFERATGPTAAPPSLWTSSLSATLPAWLDRPAVWHNASSAPEVAIDGVEYAVEFVIKLDQLKINGSRVPALSDIKHVFAGINASVDAVTGSGYYYTNNVNKCPVGGVSDATKCVAGNGLNNPFLDDVSLWTPLVALNTVCTGISLTSDQIAATKCSDNSGRTNCIELGDKVSNTFSASPSFNGARVSDGAMSASFRVSNWGSVADPAEWLPVASATNTANVAATSCSNSGTKVCAQAIPTDWATPHAGQRFHQCMQAQLGTVVGPGRAPLTFTNSSTYINTFFEPASVIDAPTTIDIRGIKDTLASNPNRDVYLHVVARNMPLPNADGMTLPVPALEALRAQMDRNFAATKNACTDPQDQCLNVGEGAACGSQCTGTGADQCTGGRTLQRYSLDGVTQKCACFPSPIKLCTFSSEPVAGGYDPTKSALSPEQVVSNQYPTFMVYPYYDTQKTVVVNGVSQKVMVPMPSFGIHAWHNGKFYGWLNGLVDMSGTTLQQVAPNIYKISVSKAKGLGSLRVMLSAEENPHYDALAEIAGAATLGAIGTFTLTGTAHTNAIDLSKAKITVQSLLGDGTTERVTNLGAPVVLTPLPGATSITGTFTSSAKPGLIINAVNVPLIGYLINLTMVGANVTRPATCTPFFGTASLVTQFKIDDGVHPAITLRGSDNWVCAPGTLIDF